MHTDTTLSHMEGVTIMVGQQLRNLKFCNVTCASFATKELPKEAAARARRTQRRESTHAAATTSDAASAPVPPFPISVPATDASVSKPLNGLPPKPKKKKLDLSTYKVHSLGDYPLTIRMFGTTDSYSTQTVS